MVRGFLAFIGRWSLEQDLEQDGPASAPVNRVPLGRFEAAKILGNELYERIRRRILEVARSQLRLDRFNVWGDEDWAASAGRCSWAM